MKDKLIIIFLLLGPILDVFSYFNIPVSIIVRGLFLGFVLILSFKKSNIKYLIPLLIFNIVYFGYEYLYLDIGLIDSVSSIFKFDYLPICILFFKDYKLNNKEKILSIILYTYLGIFLLSYIFNIGGNIYLDSDGKSGFKGLFTSINEFSAIVISLLFYVSNFYNKNKKYLLLILVNVLVLLCSILAGTKILLGGLIFNIIYILILNRNVLFIDRSIKYKIISIFVVLLSIACLGYLFTKTRTYENMKIQNDFFKVDSVFSYDFFNKVIYNDRLTFLSDNYDYFSNQNINNILLGISFNNYDVKNVEIDIFDILFRYGVVGLIVFVYSIISIFSVKSISKEELISIILLLLISLTSGHVLIYPAVCIYFGILISKTKEII